MTGPACDLCARPVDGTAFACSRCAQHTAEKLERIAELAAEVELAILKLVRYGAGGQGSGERPVPFDDARAERAAAVGNTLSTWARHVAESRGVPIPHPRGLSGAATAATFLAGEVEWLRHQQEAAEAFGDLQQAAREVEGIVDRPRDRGYRGPCWAELADVDEAGEPLRCQEDLYVPPGAKVAKCRECGAEHDAEARREWLMGQAEDQLLHAELMARALTALGVEELTSSRIRNLAARGRLIAHGHDQIGRPLYRVGDVLDVIEEQGRIEADRQRRRDAKAARRAAKTQVAHLGEPA